MGDEKRVQEGVEGMEHGAGNRVARKGNREGRGAGGLSVLPGVEALVPAIKHGLFATLGPTTG